MEINNTNLKNTNLKDLLKRASQLFDNSIKAKHNDLCTHSSMGSRKTGLYMNKHSAHEFYLIWCELLHRDFPVYTCNFGCLAELPKQYHCTQLFIDFDRKKEVKSEDDIHILTSDEEITEIISLYQSILKSVINAAYMNISRLDCIVLKKEPYIKNEEDKLTLKHGFHLQFPNVFLSSDDRNRIILIAKSQWKNPNEIDNVCNNPWLIYGSQKNSYSGFYTVDHIVCENGNKIHDINMYFNKYHLLDNSENQIKFTDEHNAIYYLPMILSLSSLFIKGEDKLNLIPEIKNVVIMDTIQNDDENDFSILELEEYKDEIMNMIDSHMEIENLFKLKKLCKNKYINLIRMKLGPCPIDINVTHNNRDAYIIVNNDKNVYIGSHCDCLSMDDKKTIKIGNLGKVNLNEDEKLYSFQSIMQKSKSDRTEEELIHIKNIQNYVMNVNLQKLFTIDNKFQIIERDYDYVDMNDLNNDSKCAIIKAGLGKGKTSSFIKYINNINDDTPIIILTPRQNFARSITQRVNLESNKTFICYLEERKIKISHKYIVIQAESLHRLEEVYDNAIIIIDESESFLYQLTSIKTHTQHIESIYTLELLLNNAKKILVFDAFISNKTVMFFYDNKIKFDIYNYNKKLEERIAVKHNKFETLMLNLVFDIKNNKKIFLFCSSRNKLKYIKEILIHYKPTINIQEYHSQSGKIINDVNDWKDADIIMCTSSITVGINFDEKDIFHKVYLIASACSRNLVRDMFQATYRIRHLIENKLEYYLDTRLLGISYNTNPVYMKTIEDVLKHKDDSMETILPEMFKFYKIKPYLQNLYMKNIFEHNMSIHFLEEIFDKYLEICNYKKINNEIDIELDIPDIDISTIDIEYDDIPILSRDEILKLTQKLIKSELEKCIICKSYFLTMIKNTISDTEIYKDLWKLFIDYGKSKFKNISIEKGIIDGSCNIKSLFELVYSSFQPDYIIQAPLIMMLTSTLNLDNSHDQSKLISKEQILSFIDIFKAKQNDYTKAFSLRRISFGSESIEVNFKMIHGVINQILSKWGYSNIQLTENKRKMINGKRVYIGNYKVCIKNSSHKGSKVQDSSSVIYDSINSKIKVDVSTMRINTPDIYNFNIIED